MIVRSHQNGYVNMRVYSISCAHLYETARRRARGLQIRAEMTLKTVCWSEAYCLLYRRQISMAVQIVEHMESHAIETFIYREGRESFSVPLLRLGVIADQ